MNDDIVEDLTLKNQTSQITERKLDFDKDSKSWAWSTPKTIKYKKLLENAHFDIIKTLISSTDLQAEVSRHTYTDTKPIIPDEKVDSGVSSLASFSDNNSIKTEVSFWELPKLTVGQTYLVFSNKHRWSTAKLTSIDPDGLRLVCVKSWEPINSTLKHVAHPKPVGNLLNIGTRVVAFATKIPSTGEIRSGRRKHVLGVVAEYPTAQNEHRYLIIFDEGLWLYVRPDEVWPVYYQSKNIWEIVPESVQEQVKNLLYGFYLRMTEYNKGDSIKYTTKDGMYHGIVICVDASLVLVWLTNLDKSEWIHRGSSNLAKS